jgi:hypothetical protein
MQIDLSNLQPADIPQIFDALTSYFQRHGLALVTDNVFLKPEALSKRWELSISCLNHWRFTGGGPVYIKTGPGPKAQVRYPLFGENGVLMFERQRLFQSTAQESGSHGNTA